MCGDSTTQGGAEAAAPAPASPRSGCARPDSAGGGVGCDAAAALVDSALAALGVFRDYSEGAVAIDVRGRIVWINKRYSDLLSIGDPDAALGAPIQQIIPESRLPEVVRTGAPILLDVMRFRDKHFVVCRLPSRDEAGAVNGAVGFVFFSDLGKLNPLIERYRKLERQIEDRDAEIGRIRRARYALSGFLGTSDRIAELRKRARMVAMRDSPVLIFGETGVGKELLAHGIHLASARASGPFVTVNAASFVEETFEARLLGRYEATRNGERSLVPGKVLLAHGGTLFIDEVDNMPLPVQAKVLRVIEDGVVEIAGGAPVESSDFRVVATTSTDLRRQVAQGKFREDLYYRIAVLPITIPPLRSRPEDLEILVENGLDRLRGKSSGFVATAEAMRLLREHEWPGNVRELFNVLERASLDAPDGEIGAAQIAAALNVCSEHDGAFGDADSGATLSESLQRAEKSAIVDALLRCKGNKEAAARRLGVSRSSLYSKLKALGVDHF